MLLIGIPASGKSTVGALLARTREVPFVETDALVEDALGAPAEEIYAAGDGEQRYREAEEAIVVRLLEDPAYDASIIALGSAAVESEAVRHALAGHQVVWLRVSVPVATRRLRLNLLGADALAAIRATIQAQLHQREAWYAQLATRFIDTDRVSPAEVAATLDDGGSRA